MIEKAAVEVISKRTIALRIVLRTAILTVSVYCCAFSSILAFPIALVVFPVLVPLSLFKGSPGLIMALSLANTLLWALISAYLSRKLHIGFAFLFMLVLLAFSAIALPALLDQLGLVRATGRL
jgi:hypothetical protein